MPRWSPRRRARLGAARHRTAPLPALGDRMHAKRLSASGWAALQLLAAACPALAQSAGAPDPWTLLGEVRRRLASEGAIATDFVQTYTPNGFTSGEKESGQLALAVPDCLRWDYEEPFPEGFPALRRNHLPVDTGRTDGRRIQVEARQQAGLDLFLLPVAALQTLSRDGRAERRADRGGARPEVVDARAQAGPSGARRRDVAAALAGLQRPRGKPLAIRLLRLPYARRPRRFHAAPRGRLAGRATAPYIIRAPFKATSETAA